MAVERVYFLYWSDHEVEKARSIEDLTIELLAKASKWQKMSLPHRRDDEEYEGAPY